MVNRRLSCTASRSSTDRKTLSAGSPCLSVSDACAARLTSCSKEMSLCSLALLSRSSSDDNTPTGRNTAVELDNVLVEHTDTSGGRPCSYRPGFHECDRAYPFHSETDKAPGHPGGYVHLARCGAEDPVSCCAYRQSDTRPATSSCDQSSPSPTRNNPLAPTATPYRLAMPPGRIR